MKTYFQVVHKLGDDMYSLYMSGSNNYFLWEEIATAAFIFDVPRTVMRSDILNYIQRVHKRKL